MPDLHVTLRRAREKARYSQDDVAAALGVSRTMVSYWETGSRTPNDRQLGALARLYGVTLIDLIEDHDVEPAGADVAGMLLRSDPEADAESSHGVREFLQFLDKYAELGAIVNDPIRGLKESPFLFRSRFSGKEDARRKAEEVRAHLRLGNGPIQDLDVVCEMLGITIFRASLGADLGSAPSGAFFNHPQIGFSILVNLDMTPGRRRFTTAHEIGHALFHSDSSAYVVSRGNTSPLETFADRFAGEFLMPQEGVRRFMEDVGMPSQITEPIDALRIQRYFQTSFPTTLVRLRQMQFLSQQKYQEFKRSVQPVSSARALGYSIDPEESEQNPELWRIRRFPQGYLRRLRKAVESKVLSPPTAASFAGLALPDLVQVMGEPATNKPGDLSTEFREFEITGVI